MHADAYYAIGRSHTVCQDYARAGDVYGRAFAIVADGCSSAPDTDFGARLLTMAALETALDADERLRYSGAYTAAHAEHLVPPQLHTDQDLPPCLAATLLTAFETRDGQIAAVAWGDGAVLTVGLAGDLTVYEIDMNGAPAYPHYLLSERRLRQYVDEFGGYRTVRTWVEGALASSEIESAISHATIDAYATERTYAWTKKFDPAQYRFIGVATDGIGSFRRDGMPEPVWIFEVAGHMTNIAVPKGQFIQRSSQHFLKKVCPKLGWHHTDDYGFAGIWIPEEAPTS